MGKPAVFDGWVDLRDPSLPRYGGSLVVQHLRPQEWLELPGPGSNLSARLAVEGAGFAASTMKARVELDVGPSLLAGLPLERAYGNIALQDGKAVVTDLSAAALGGELDGSGSLDRQGGVAVHLRASVPDVASAEPWVPRSVGRLSGGAELRLSAEAMLPLNELSALAKRSPQQIWERLGPGLKVALALRGDRLAAGDRQVGRLALLVNKEAGAEVPLDALLQLEQVHVGGLREGRTRIKARLVGRELDLSVSGAATGGLSLELAAGASLAEEQVEVRLRSFSASREQLAVNLVGEGRASVTLAEETAGWADAVAAATRGGAGRGRGERIVGGVWRAYRPALCEAGRPTGACAGVGGRTERGRLRRVPGSRRGVGRQPQRADRAADCRSERDFGAWTRALWSEPYGQLCPWSDARRIRPFGGRCVAAVGEL